MWWFVDGLGRRIDPWDVQIEKENAAVPQAFICAICGHLWMNNLRRSAQSADERGVFFVGRRHIVGSLEMTARRRIIRGAGMRGRCRLGWSGLGRDIGGLCQGESGSGASLDACVRCRGA